MKAIILLSFCAFLAYAAVPLVMRPAADPNLLINKLQETLQEIARGVDESALETVIGNLKGDSDIDINAADVMNIINNIEMPPTDPAVDDYDDEVVETVKEEIQIDEKEIQIEMPIENAVEDENDDMSSEAIRYNSKGESIENPKAHAVVSVACKDEKELPKIENVEQPQALEEKSSSTEDGQRLWDADGNSIEQSTSNEDNNQQQGEETMEITKMPRTNEKINQVLNKKVGEMRDNQLNMRQMESDESGFRDDDEIPVITIPMGQILKTYNQMMNRAAGVYDDETEEYSDEMTTPGINFDNPHLKNILRKISNERKRAALDQLDPKTRKKTAALRVLDGHDEYSESAEDL